MTALRYLTAGESHGPGLVVIVEGAPAGLEIGIQTFADELRRRRVGYGRGARMKLETDELELLGGIRHGRTLGSPVAVLIRNTEWEKWSSVMSAEPVEDPPDALTRPRPGHADLVGMLKYAHRDARNVLERSSARETTARTVAGVVAKAILRVIGAKVVSHVLEIGDVRASGDEIPGPGDAARVDESPVRTLDTDAETAMIAAIDAAKADGDTLGGIFEVLAYGIPAGLGSYVHWDRKIDARLAQAVMSIQAMKGVAFGDGFEVARRRGSEAHDEILWNAERGYHRPTDRAGGIEGGMTTGDVVRLSVAMKPLSTLRRALRTVDVETKQEAIAIVERSDVCPVPSACVIGEAVTALTLADAALEKFGGDSVGELADTHRRWIASLEQA